MQAALRSQQAWHVPGPVARREREEELLRRQRRAHKQARRLHIAGFAIFAVCLAFLGVLLFATLCARVTIAQNSAKMQTLDKQMADEKLQQSKLQVEVAELFSPGRIERLASRNLGMVLPATVRSIATEEYRLARMPVNTNDASGQLGQVTEELPY